MNRKLKKFFFWKNVLFSIVVVVGGVETVENFFYAHVWTKKDESFQHSTCWKNVEKLKSQFSYESQVESVEKLKKCGNIVETLLKEFNFSVTFEKFSTSCGKLKCWNCWKFVLFLKFGWYCLKNKQCWKCWNCWKLCWKMWKTFFQQSFQHSFQQRVESSTDPKE